VTVAVTGFVAVCFILLYAVMKNDAVRETIKHETNLARTVVKSTRYAMLHNDRDSLQNIIGNIGNQEGVEHIRIFNKKGFISFSKDITEKGKTVDKSAAGCIECHRGPEPAAVLGDMKQARRFTNKKGTEVIAITVPIYNEHECFTAPCHFHAPTQKILGTLDIGLSAEPLSKSLALIRQRMIIFCIMVLIITLGGVAALLRRYVFIPLRALIDYTEKVAKGSIDEELPAAAWELKELARNIRCLAREIKKLKQDKQ